MRMKMWRTICLAVLLMMGSFGAPALAGQQPLTVYAGAGLMKPMDELKTQFEARYKIPVQLIYGGSGELFGMIATRKAGDVFIPGADKYNKDAVKQGLARAEGQKLLCYHVPVILVPAGNPAKIQSLRDLARPGVRVALADAKAAAIGKVGNEILTKNNLMETVAKNTVVRPSTTNQLLIYAATGQVDACIAWEDQATWGQARGKVDIVQIPAAQNSIKTIPASVVTYSQQADRAQAFIDYIASPEGKALWRKWGFPVARPE
ncbi:molybdate ABC transporter substrate-binding protein [Syntrophotalea acetylenica]|uniref:Molybdate ABC transporter substrate-binding protein n=1 Tax=Syntrophotalea acetylenica TaxID=29542 RepID=A0A1L3GGJ5_SYNAC|nr:molybdate ABC transporter substrate-binding protein [Syntrophotalea acetylenica]APG24999.1 molybdate ABC transporter substrate-binding protein [Syntrophotalea acetylenica]APG43067.1 molybdenum ABC transporter substrate-binding protein [Syntrophotalea acetylenica]